MESRIKKVKRKAILLLAYIADVSCFTNRSFYMRTLSLSYNWIIEMAILFATCFGFWVRRKIRYWENCLFFQTYGLLEKSLSNKCYLWISNKIIKWLELGCAFERCQKISILNEYNE